MAVQIMLKNGEGDSISNHDLAVLADWAEQQKKIAPPAAKRAFDLLCIGADLLQRQRALAGRATGEMKNASTTV